MHLNQIFGILKLTILIFFLQWNKVFQLITKLFLLTSQILFMRRYRNFYFIKCWKLDRFSDLMRLLMDSAICKIWEFLHTKSTKALFLLSLKVIGAYMDTQMRLQIIAISKKPSLTLIKRAQILFSLLASFVRFWGSMLIFSEQRCILFDSFVSISTFISSQIFGHKHQKILVYLT